MLDRQQIGSTLFEKQLISSGHFARKLRLNEEITMTHFNTARINEMLGLQLGVIRDIALKLDGDNLEQLERNLSALEAAIKDIRSMAEGLPHRHQS